MFEVLGRLDRRAGLPRARGSENEPGAPSLGHSVFSVYAAFLLMGAATVTLPASGPLLRDRLAMGDALYGAFFLPGYTLGILISLASPWIMRRWSLRRLYLFALLQPALMVGLIPLTPRIDRLAGIGVLFAAMMLFGIAAGICAITLNAAAMAIFPRARGRALAMLHASLGVGAALWPLAVALAIARGLWGGALVALALCFLAVWAVARRRPIRGLEHQRRAIDGRTDVPVRLRWRALTALIYGVIESLFTAWGVVFLAEDRGLSIELAAGALSAFWIAQTGGRMLATLVLKWMPAKRMGLVLSALMGLAFLVIGRSQAAAPALAGFAFAGLACSAGFPVLLSLAAEELPDRQPHVSAILSAAVMAGLGIGSFAVGPLRAWWELDQIYAGAAALPVVLGALILMLGEQPARETGAGSPAIPAG